LDPTIIANLMAEMHGAGTTPNPTGFTVSTATPELIDAWLHMMRLIDRPNEATILAAMIEREILFRADWAPRGQAARSCMCG